MRGRVIGEESVEVMGKTVPAYAVDTTSSNLPGMTTHAWLAADAAPVRSIVDVGAMKFDMLLADQTEPAGGTVAEHLGIPFVTICNALALNREPWGARTGYGAFIKIDFAKAHQMAHRCENLVVERAIGDADHLEMHAVRQ